MLIEVEVVIRSRGRTTVHLTHEYYAHDRRGEEELIQTATTALRNYRGAVEADSPRRVATPTNGTLAAAVGKAEELEA